MKIILWPNALKVITWKTDGKDFREIGWEETKLKWLRIMSAYVTGVL